MRKNVFEIEVLFVLSRLKERRSATGLTQAELAAKVGVTRRSVIRWESGQTIPGVRKIERIAEALDCEVEDLGRTVTP